jgi:gliding motility-associated-like protein
MTSVSQLEAAGLTISDNCITDANLVVTSSDGTASGTCPITFTRTYTITDACNNVTTVSQIITINDTTAPVVTGTLTASNINGCSIADTPAAMTTVAALEAADLTISDNCTTDANLVVTSSDGTATGTCPITFTRTYIITDACNNVTTVSQIININDTIAPVVTGTLTASNINGCSIADAPAAMTSVSQLEAVGLTISDNCTTDVNLVVTSSDGAASGTCPITFTRTYTITDACNNTTNAIQTININDTIAPVITGTLPLLAISGCSIASVPAAMSTVSALETAGLVISDNCTTDSNLVVTSIDGLSIGSCPITLIRTYTITDICGNSTIKTQSITINDTASPVVSGELTPIIENGCSILDAPTAMTSVSQLETAGLTISDACTLNANLVVTHSDSSTSGTCPITFIRTYTLTDICGNFTSKTQTITINDTLVPVITGTLTASNINGCSIADAPAAMTSVSQLEVAGLTISDNCTTDVNLVVTSSDGTATGTCPITFTRTYTITDACNNATTATQNININDTTAPVVTGILATVNASGCSIADAPAAMITVAALEAAGLTISDNCTTNASLVVTSSDGTATGTCPITFTRTYTIKDACNNATTVTQTININDTIAPVVTGTLTASNINGCSIADAPAALTTVAALETVGLTISDNCTTDVNLVVTSSDGTVTGTCPITFTRTYTIKDACNNATTATQIITINDTTVPAVTGTLTASNINGCSIADAPAALTTVAALEVSGLTISDNCTTDANLVVTSSDGTATGTCPITFTRTYTIKDACNNATTATQTIIINDTVPPVVTGTIIASNTNGCSVADAPVAMTSVSQLEAAGLSISDNCTTDVNLVVTHTNGIPTGTCPITFTRAYKVTDACGNFTTASQIININDTTAPIFSVTVPQNITLECNQTIPSAAIVTATDNCNGLVTINFTEQNQPGTCPNNYSIIRTWVATDICGNSQTHTQQITIQDTTPPVFVGSLPSNEVFAKCDGIPVAPVLTATDNCGSATVTYSEVKIDGDCTNKYRLERTWTATDSCGNETQITQTVYLACYVTPYNALSPDGDGLNDVFIIEGLECYPNNTVQILNRWGVLVFEAAYYDNVNNVFRGFSDGRSTVSRNDKLPTGNYWYILKYEYDLYGRTKENIEKIGYIYIQNE